jgi:hypothetical protein
MLISHEIQQALHASRVVELPPGNSHGLLGLEHLAALVDQAGVQAQEAPARTGCAEPSNRPTRPKMTPAALLAGIASCEELRIPEPLPLLRGSFGTAQSHGATHSSNSGSLLLAASTNGPYFSPGRRRT